MGYYGSMRGDYYKGDPFLGALAGAAVGAIGKLAGKAAGWVGKQVSGSKKVAAPATIGSMPVLSSPIIKDIALPALGGAAVGGGITAVTRYLGGKDEKKRRRMNPLNPKALKRALRRAEGFETFAKRTVNALYKTSSCGCSKKSRKFKRA